MTHVHAIISVCECAERVAARRFCPMPKVMGNSRERHKHWTSYITPKWSSHCLSGSSANMPPFSLKTRAHSTDPAFINSVTVQIEDLRQQTLPCTRFHQGPEMNFPYQSVVVGELEFEWIMQFRLKKQTNKPKKTFPQIHLQESPLIRHKPWDRY